MPPLIKNLLSAFSLTVLLSISSYAQGNFVYVNNDSDPVNTVSGFSIGPGGALTPVAGSPFLTGSVGPSSGGLFAINRATVSAVGRFLFVSNLNSGNVSAFSINPISGVLTLVPGSPFSTGGTGECSIAPTPDGQFLIGANDISNNITVFSIAGNGALAIVPGSPVPAGGTPDGIKVSPNGKFLAVALVFSDAVQMFSIGSNGSLTQVPGSPFVTTGPGAAAGVEINCASNLLFVGEAVGSGTTVDVFNIDPNGALTPAPGSPFVVSSGDNSNIVLLSSDERSLFVSNQFSNSVTVFTVAASGGLTLVPGSPFLNGGSPFAFSLGMATNQSGTFLYDVNDEADLSGFAIAANGALIPVPGSPFMVPSSGRPGVAVYPAKNCNGFDLCIQDDSNGNILKVNSTTGDYLFTICSGFSTGGRGTITKKGSSITLEHSSADRRVLARYDGSAHKATASVQVFPLAINATIADRNTADNTCTCN